MNLGELSSALGMFVGFILTLCIFSYILGDNPLFRFAIHLVIGVSAAIVVLATWRNVLWPQLFKPLMAGNLILLAPLGMALLLLAKATPRLAFLGQPVMAFLVGVGAAAIVGGAVLGTLFPQSLAAASSVDAIPASGDLFSRLGGMANAAIMLIGALAVLLYFQFTIRSSAETGAPKSLISRLITGAGQVFIAITFGVIFAGVYSSALTALIDRLNFIVQFLWSFIAPVG